MFFTLPYFATSVFMCTFFHHKVAVNTGFRWQNCNRGDIYSTKAFWAIAKPVGLRMFCSRHHVSYFVY